MKKGIHILCLLGGVLLFGTCAFGSTLEDRVNALEEMVRKQSQTIKEQQEVINKLLPQEEPQTKVEEKVAEETKPAEESGTKPDVSELTAQPLPSTAVAARSDLWSRQIGGSKLRLIDISLDALFAAGSSSATNEQLQDLEGGDHDPRWRGFTVQNVELSLSGAVDPYFTGESHIVFFIDPSTGDTQVELEEAFLTTQSLPYRLQTKAGYFFTEFGRINPLHPHQWHWLDQPVINTRLFGPDGMRQAGARLSWLTPLPWYSELLFGIQNANGETMASFLANQEFFEERPIGGRPFTDQSVKSLKDLVYLARFENFWDISESVTARLGFSGLYGPNATGPDVDTWIYGTDLVVKWRPPLNERGWPFLVWESELMQRDYQAAAFLGPNPDNPEEILDLPAQTLIDWGFYTQLLYGFHPGWATGLRYEYASGRGQSVGGSSNDPFRDNRLRLSPLLVWHPSEFSRLRLQFNYDHAQHLEHKDAYSAWLGVEFLYGAHAAHKY
ncbi:MAG TPA: TonB-dependent receptor [Geobacteraceae bacterium]|nr:TonB-dependent receptor [Geobacteraceae bacterium]